MCSHFPCSKAHNQKVLKGDLHFRDSFREMLLSVSDNGHDFESCKELLRQSEFCLLPLSTTKSSPDWVLRRVSATLLLPRRQPCTTPSLRGGVTTTHPPTKRVQPVPNMQLADIGLDPGFETFYSWCKENGIPVIIVSR